MRAFSMLELIFVLMILALLAAFALPKLHFSAQESKSLALKAQFALIQSALTAHKNDIFLNKGFKLARLDNAKIGTEKEALFYCFELEISTCQNGSNCCAVSLLESPIYSSFQGWMKTGANTYRFKLGKESMEFEFKPMTQSFECLKNCEFLR